MPKSVMPFYEPKPYYMTAMGMAGARFIEGVPDPVVPIVVEPVIVPAPVVEPPKKDDDDFKSPESKAAVLADLQKERDQRKLYQGQATERETQVQTLTESLAESATAVTERDAQLAAKDAEIAVLKLTNAHGITDAEDIALLTSIADTEKREALAKRLAVNNSIVPRGNDSAGTQTAGSLAGGRDLYNSRKK